MKHCARSHNFPNYVAYKYTSSLHCYSLYSFTMRSTNDVRVASGESAEAKEREGFKEGAEERELTMLLRQPNNGKSG